jgi:predicted cobalt transporter CbtA
LLILVIAGGALAAYNPMLGMGTGGLTLAIAAIYKKRWTWWIVGVVILVVGLFFYWSDKNEAESGSGDTS